MQASIGRRRLLTGTGAALLLGGLEGCATTFGTKGTPKAPALQLVPVRASTDRITRITVCTRPFRAQGPRLDAEQIGSKLVVHNYGHGGSGWSLSWGSSGVAVRKAMASGERDIAVIGCGALGRPSDDLRQGFAAECQILSGQRTLDSRFAHLPRRKRDTGVQAALGTDDQELVPDLSKFSGAKRHAGRIHRSILRIR
jgi:hypothetical protein